MSMKSVNLIPVSRQLNDARRARGSRWSIGCAVLIATLFVLDRALQISFTRSMTIDPAQFTRLENEIDAKTRTCNQLRREINAIDRLVRAGHAVTEHPDYSMLLSLLSETAGREIRLELCSIDRHLQIEDTAKDLTPVLRLNGVGTSQSAVTSFVLRLESTGVFDQVALLRSNEQNDAGATSTAFQIECMFDDTGKETP